MSNANFANMNILTNDLVPMNEVWIVNPDFLFKTLRVDMSATTPVQPVFVDDGYDPYNHSIEAEK